MFWVFLSPTQIRDGMATIEGPRGRHLSRVLRVKAGETGVAVSGGLEHRLEVVRVEASTVRARVIEVVQTHSELAADLIVLQALLPSADFEAVLEGGTQVGVTRFIPILAERSIARPQGDRRPRWQAVVEAAAEQSHRGRIPEVTAPMTLTEALRALGGTRLVVLDPGATEPIHRWPGPVAVAVGPEGGWSQEEVAEMAAAGASRATLGPRILRARLAPVAAAVILSSAT